MKYFEVDYELKNMHFELKKAKRRNCHFTLVPNRE